ncbi:short-chain dehydrogenase [Xylariaceae sp. FL1272]|nr:short-chain dehydrogenase [Xylariaceae sp. FL1272]
MNLVNGPGDSRPTGRQVVEDENLVGAWEGKVVLITGVSSVSGVATARVLASTGATVFGTASNLDKAREALGSELIETGRVKLLHVDQTDLSSVRACPEEFRKKSSVLNIFVNNAAVMNSPESHTKDGFDLQFGMNHLSHFLLFYLLQHLLLASSTPHFHSHVVSVSSAGHCYSPLNLDDLNFEGEYNGWLAYGSSKTANIYMANMIERLYGEKGLHGYSVHRPNLQKHSQAEMEAASQDEKFNRYISSTEQACATTVYGAVSSELEGASTTVLPVPKDSKDAFEYRYAEWAFDKERDEKLWNLREEMVKVE